MNDIRPWYRWHVYRYESSEHVLEFCSSKRPASCHGCYRNLLDAMWKQGCRLTTNRDILWNLAKCGCREEYEEVADLVEACFEKSDDGKWFTSQTLTDEWNSASELLEKRRNAGHKGGKASAQANVKQTSSTPQASSSSSNSNKETIDGEVAFQSSVNL